MKPFCVFSILITMLAAVGSPVMAASMPVVVPTISIVSVVPNQTVTISTSYFPPGDNYDVFLGPYGSQGINGVKVATVNSDGGGILTFTFNIPPQFVGMNRIAIRLQSPYSGYYSYNWFYNDPSNPQPPYPPYPPYPPQPYVPTFNITSVVKDQTVTILTNNFPVNDNFDVFMGPIGTQGINGIKVATINSNGGGSFAATFNIPPALFGAYQISIRLQSLYSGYYSYNWFYNNPIGQPVPWPTQPYPYPNPYPDPYPYPNPYPLPTFVPISFTINNVVRNQSVTITTANFPANDNFDVYMGPSGSSGLNGVKVATLNSANGGTFTSTFTIPPSLFGLDKISIRVQSPYSGYYAYNWFWNNTYP